MDEEDENYFARYRPPEPPPAEEENYFARYRPRQELTPPPAEEENYFARYRPPKSSQPQAPPEPEAESTIGTALRSAAHAVLPSAAGLAGIPAGIAGGAALGLPAGGWGAIPGAIVGGIAGYYAGTAAQETALKAMGFDDSQQQAVNARTNPKSALVGEIAGALPTVGVGAGAQIATRVGGALGGGLLEAGSQALGGEDWDPTRIAGAAVAGGLLTKPTRLGEAIGSGTARAIGRPELWHGAGGPDAAGTSKEQPPPRPAPDAGAELPTDHYAKPPRVTEVEPPPDVLVGGRPGQPIEGETPAPPVTPVDPAIDAAINKRPIQPPGVEAEPPTQYGPALDREFPRVTEMPAETPPVAEAPGVENLAARTPREAMEQKAPEETYGDALKRLAGDERGGALWPFGRRKSVKSAEPVDPKLEQQFHALVSNKNTPPEHYGELASSMREVGMNRYAAMVEETAKNIERMTPARRMSIPERRNLAAKPLTDNDYNAMVDNYFMQTGSPLTGEVSSDQLTNILKQLPADSFPEGPYRVLGQELVKRLDDLVGHVPTHFVSDNDMLRYVQPGHSIHGLATTEMRSNGEAGRQFISLNDASMKAASPGKAAYVIMHEATHAAADERIARSPELKNRIRSIMDEARPHLEALEGTPFANALKDEHEFMADSHSHVGLQDKLHDIPASPALIAKLQGNGRIHSLWDAFVDIVRRSLGLGPNSNSLLEMIIRVGDEAHAPIKPGEFTGGKFTLPQTGREELTIAQHAMAGRKPTTEEPGAGPVARATDELGYGLASQLIDRPTLLKTEAAKRGMTPKALKAQAQELIDRTATAGEEISKVSKTLAEPVAEAMPTPGVIEGPTVPGAKAKNDAALADRGFTPEEIAKMKPKAKEAILQKREGEIGSKPAEKEAPAPCPTGDCFNAAYQKIKANPERTLVQGQVTADGKRFAHAWTEDATHVFETSNKQNAAIPKAEYYREFNVNPNDPKEYASYSHEQALIKSVKSKHYGPWDISEKTTPVAAEALDPKLANRMLNQPAVLKSEAAKRGITPEALKVQATEALKTAPAAPPPGQPMPLSPVGGGPAPAIATGKPSPALAAATGGAPPVTPTAPAAAAAATPTPPAGPTLRAAHSKDLADGLWAAIRRTFVPELSPSGRTGMDVFREHKGEAVQMKEAQLARFDNAMHYATNKMSDMDQRKLVNYIEGGEHLNTPGHEIHDPNWRPPAIIRKVADQIKQGYAAYEHTLSQLPQAEQAKFLEDYLTHMYKNPQPLIDRIGGGAGGFGSLKKRVHETYEHAREAGHEPLTTNPIEIFTRYAMGAERAITKQKTINDLESRGYLDWFKPKSVGATGAPEAHVRGAPPEGYAPVPSFVNKQGATAYVPKDMAYVMNHQFGPTFQSPSGEKIVDALRRFKNFTTNLELGMSLYHPFTVGVETIARGVKRSIEQMGTSPDQIARASKTFIKAFGEPISNIPLGKEWIERYTGKRVSSVEQARILDAMKAADIRPVGIGHTMEYDLTSSRRKSMGELGSLWTSWQRGSLEREFRESGKAIMGGDWNEGMMFVPHLAGRILRTTAQPIFETYIPRMKIASLALDLQAYVAQNPTVSREDLAAVARRMSSSIDRTMGEMVTDHIGMNKAWKSAAFIGMRSYSFTVGGPSELVGGLISGVKGAVKGENRYSMSSQHYDPKAASPIAYAVVIGGLASMWNYMRTGEFPQDWRDYVTPRTGGEVISGGQPAQERVLLPGYHKDFLGYAFHPKEEVSAKMAGVVNAFKEQITGRDYRGDPIAPPVSAAGLGANVAGRAEHLGKSLIPLSFKQISEPDKTGSNIHPVEQALGFRAPGAYIQNPERIAQVKEIMEQKAWRTRERHVNADRAAKGLPPLPPMRFQQP